MTETHDEICDCSECCEHVETDHGICLDCGKDCTDALIARAESLYEGER